MRQMLSTRATLIGCERDFVLVRSPIERFAFSLAVTKNQAEELAPHVGSEFDVVADVERRAGDGMIVDGILDTFEPVINADPRPAWREWFGAHTKQR